MDEFIKLALYTFNHAANVFPDIMPLKHLTLHTFLPAVFCHPRAGGGERVFFVSCHPFWP